VNLVTDLLARLQAHHYQLSILAGVKNLTEIFIFLCLFFNVSNNQS